MNNIVLIGMMGSGKTTCGKLLAQRLNLTFADSDELIVEREGRSISEIFASDGEDAFRDLESAAIADLGRQENMVIATGGGAVLRGENVTALREHGTVFFLNRDPAEIFDSVAMDGRPLAQQGKEDFLNRFRTREPIYRASADYVIEDCATAEEVVEQIMRRMQA